MTEVASLPAALEWLRSLRNSGWRNAGHIDVIEAALSPAPSAGVGVDNPADTDGGVDGDWYCEWHPWALQSHDGCDGAGMPACARIGMLTHIIRMRDQEIRERDQQYGFLAELALSQHPAAPSVSPAYDRELIACMLETAAGVVETWSEGSMREQARLLREADNTEAANIGTVSLSPAVEGDGLVELVHKLETLRDKPSTNIEHGQAITEAIRRLASSAPQGEAVTVETVGFVRKNSDGDLYVDWTPEGGIHALGEGCELIASAVKLTDDTGMGEVYITPPPAPAVEQTSVNHEQINSRLIVDSEVIAEQPQGEWPAGCEWPSNPFSVHDEPGEHDPCWLVTPSGEMVAFNHHATNGVDQARAQFVADACNAARMDPMAARVLAQRDRYHEIADELANGIAAHFGWNIGEHSSLNDPWQNTLAMLSAAPSRPVVDEVEPLRAEVERLTAIINTPQSGEFLRAVSIEAEHQRQRWASDHDAGKTPADWFWLIGYLAGKALHSHNAGDVSKAEHHIITTAAACQNWHGAMFGATEMRPGIDGAAALGQQGDGNGQ